MVVLIAGASHTGKTALAQSLLEQKGYPYLSIDLLKMGLIRSGQTNLSPEDDAELTEYLWPIVREMVKTAIENDQNLILEGCYLPFDWKKEFDDAVFDDLNMPLAMSVIWKALRSSVKSDDIYDFVCACDTVLGLNLKEDAELYAEKKRNIGETDDISDEIKALVEERTAAKKNKDFARADAIRNQLKEMGYSLLDTREGVKIMKD